MDIRKCPQCLAVVPAGRILAQSNDIECPGCKRPLEISAASRSIAMLAGLAAAALVWRLTRASGGMLGWALSVLYAFLGFSLISALALILLADLRSKPEEPVGEPEHNAASHRLVQLGPGSSHP